jgi:glutathione S-transferase
MTVTLYYHPLSSYCWKVLIALYENGTPFEKRAINLADPGDRAVLAQHWPLAKFPVIHDHAHMRDLAESSIIIEYLDRYWAGPQPLISGDWDEALEVRLWDRVFDNHVQGPMQQMVVDRMRNTQLDLSKERATLLTAYRLLDRHLDSRTWMGRPGFSLADCAAAPALFYARAIEPIPVELEHLGEYFERLVKRPSVQRVLEEAKPYFQYFPFADNLQARFR